MALPSALRNDRKPDRRTEADIWRMESRAAGMEMQHIAAQLVSAVVADDIHRTMHWIGRLADRGRAYAPEGEPA